MVREPDATMQPTPQNNQLMSKHRVLSLKPQLRLEWRGQDGQSETEQPDHSASLGDSITLSTRIRFSVHTGQIIRRAKSGMAGPYRPVTEAPLHHQTSAVGLKQSPKTRSEYRATIWMRTARQSG